MRINAIYYRKENSFETNESEIEKIIELSKDEFESFQNDMMQDRTFITENKKHMFVDDHEVTHCLLVLGEGHDDGILVDCQGFGYARYAAFVPNARQIVFMEQRYNCVQDLESCLMGAADDVASQALAYDGEGDFRITLDALSDKHGFDVKYATLLAEMLREHAAVNDVIVFSDEMMISVNRQNEKEKQHYRPTDDELEIMKAKHILWNHDVSGGEQADFSNMDLTDCYLANTDLNGAVFKGAILKAATLGNGSYTFCDFTDADLYGVDAVDSVFEESDFTGAKLIGCHFLSSHFTNCNFTGADLSGSDFNLAVLDNSDFTDAKINDAKLENARMNNCTGLSAEPDEDEAIGMTM